MRRLLLATTAVLGGTLGGAGLANAQTTPAPTMVPSTQFTGIAAAPGAIPYQAGAPFTAVPGPDAGAEHADRAPRRPYQLLRHGRLRQRP